MEITHRNVERRYAGRSGRAVTLEGRETSLRFDWGSGGWYWSYLRPRLVYFDDSPDTPIPLRDYVMHSRVAIVMISIALFSIRRSLR